MPTTDAPKEYWQITRYYRNGGCDKVLKHSYEEAFQEYCNTLLTMTACDGDSLSLYQVSADDFVTLWFTTTIGQPQSYKVNREE